MIMRRRMTISKKEYGVHFQTESEMSKRKVIDLTVSDDEDENWRNTKESQCQESCVDLRSDDELDDGRGKIAANDENEVAAKMAWHLFESTRIPPEGNQGAAKSFRQVMDAGTLSPQWVVLSNMLYDWSFILGEWPELLRVPRVVIFQHDQAPAPPHFEVHCRNPKEHGITHPDSGKKSTGDSVYGSHHAKFAILGFANKVRVVITTANFVPSDVKWLSQGVWYQDFPRRLAGSAKSIGDFGLALCDYTQQLLNYGGGPATSGQWGPQFRGSLPQALKQYDFSGATAYLIPVVPGFHRDENLRKYGQTRVRDILSCHCRGQRDGTIIMQFSSMARAPDKYIEQLTETFGGNPATDKLHIVWPTDNDIRNSTAGYAAGNSLPARRECVDALHRQGLLHKWTHDSVSLTSPLIAARKRAVPHLKSMTRVLPDRVTWSIMTSSNLSKSSWGDIQKKGTQLFCQNWELGILVTPASLRVDRICTTQQYDNAGAQLNQVHIGIVPLPYPSNPPIPYDAQDVPWCSRQPLF